MVKCLLWLLFPPDPRRNRLRLLRLALSAGCAFLFTGHTTTTTALCGGRNRSGVVPPAAALLNLRVIVFCICMALFL